MKKKTILDRLCELYPEEERKKLYSGIMCGEVRLKGETIREPGRMVPGDSQPEFSLKKYVSRGGYKLEKVLDYWNIDVKGKGFLDAGCSTGGFTDCLLQKGASFVHAVDVGYNQLDYSLRVDERVYVHERTNIMHLTSLDPVPDGAVADLSFRSISDAASKIISLVSGRFLIALVKPQFEVENPGDDFDGVLRDGEQILLVARQVMKKLRDEGCFVTRIDLSPVKGRKGNQELLFLIGDREEVPSSELEERLDFLLRNI